jgi:2-dehydro-3-deoxygluconokinase
LGVDTKYMLKQKKGRLGLFFLETGANQRPSNVIYDREYSAISLTKASEYPWKEIFEGGKWFHVSGITPAISKEAADTVLTAIKLAKESGLTVSFDLNFRKKLWQWDNSFSPRELAEKTIKQMLPFVDLVIGNEEDASDVLGISAGHSDAAAGKLEIDKYPEVAKKIIQKFPNITKVAITLRESISATHNNWGGMLYDGTLHEAFFAPMNVNGYEPYQIKNIVDRVGGGDSFAAGLIYALTTAELSQAKVAISFAAAASCLAHSIQGDFNYSSRQEVESLMKGSASGRVVR